MLRIVSALAALCSTLLVLPRPALAAPSARAQTVRVLVQLKGQPLAADPNLRARSKATLFRYRLDPSLAASRMFTQALTRYQDQEISYLKQQGIRLSVGRRLNVLFNGFSATVPADQVSRLRLLPNVAGVLLERTYRPLLDRSVPLIHAPEAWSVLGGSARAGRGQMIAEIDTGIEITNPCFSDTTMPAPPYPRRSDIKANLIYTNNKVIVARAFGPDSGKQYSAEDTSGHGTFGGSIEACDYNTPTPLGTRISGVAPAAYLLSYNVFPGYQIDPSSGDLTQISNQGTQDAQIIAALEAALLDGADVANLSLGVADSGDPRLDPQTEAISLAVRAGMTVVASAGNAGPTMQTVGSPASAPDAIAVGAVTNARAIYSSLSISGGNDVPAILRHAFANMGSHPFSGTVGPLPMVYVGLGRTPKQKGASDGSFDPADPNANDFAGKDVHGKIALIQRGITFFESKVNNAAKAGATAAIVYDNRQEAGLPNIDTKSATLPMMFISQDAGKALLAYLQSHADAQATLDSTQTAVDEIPGVLSDFSSVGYSAGFSIKPDLVGPGQDIYAAAESKETGGELYSSNGFLSSQGTSFSAPHVTGAVALVLQKHPTWTPAQVKAVLMDTSNTSVYLDESKSRIASVMQAGSGLVDVEAALQSTAYLTPASVTFGEVNVASGAVQQDGKLTLNDIGTGSGAWEVSVHALGQTTGVTVTAPAGVSLAGGHVDVPLHLSVAASTPIGDYDGYIELTRDGQTIHAPYFVHVLSQAVTPGSILLVDDTTSRFQTDPPNPPVPHLDVSKYYTDTLTKLGKSYTYWNEGTLGTPPLDDMKRASAVIYFTGANLNGFAPQNTNQEALVPALGPTDYAILHSYLDSGGKLFVTGPGAALADPNFTAILLGGVASSLSMYDNKINDAKLKGGISPPRPSALVRNTKGQPNDSLIFVGLKPIDFSTKGDGAHDNLASNNQSLNDMLGVPGLTSIRGSFGFQGNAYGVPALQTSNVNLAQGGIQGTNVAVVSSDEPSFKHKASYAGRAVLFSFTFDGINDNTGYATREQVMSRILQWFVDHPTARVTSTRLRSGTSVQLGATVSGGSGAHAAQYTWQVGSQTLRTTSKPTQYRFPHAGRYSVRVQIIDSLGHVAVSPWRTITVS